MLRQRARRFRARFFFSLWLGIIGIGIVSGLNSHGRQMPSCYAIIPTVSVSEKPRIEDLPGFTVVGLETTFIHAMHPNYNGDQVLPGHWREFSRRAEEIQASFPGHAYGLLYAEESERQASGMTTYLAGVQTQGTAPVPQGMRKVEVGPGRWAIFTHTGTLDGLRHSQNYAYTTWFPASGERMRPGIHVEYYSPRSHGDNPEIEFWIPLA